jgi:hypothetical protein
MNNFKRQYSPMPLSRTINSKVAIRFKALKRKIYILPALPCFILPALFPAQNNKIGKLKKVLPLLHDSAIVHGLNVLSDGGATWVHKDFKSGLSKIYTNYSLIVNFCYVSQNKI